MQGDSEQSATLRELQAAASDPTVQAVEDLLARFDNDELDLTYRDLAIRIVRIVRVQDAGD